MKDFSALVDAADKSVNVAINFETIATELDQNLGTVNTGLNLNFETIASDLNRKLKKTEEPRRPQVGFFHVWIRGSNRYNVFYNKTDYVNFLERCQMAAERNQTVISAFVLMDNHVHLQVYTRSLNAFMKSLLMSFNQWYNRRRGLRGQLFNSPFSSKLIDNEDYLRYNFLYILTNPVRAGICENITKYQWSSYHFFKKSPYNHLSKYIVVSDLVSGYLFKSYNELQLNAYKHLKEFWSINEGKNAVSDNEKCINEMDKNKKGNREIGNQVICNRKKGNSEKIENERGDNDVSCRGIRASHYAINLIKPTDQEVAKYLEFILRGRKLNEISREELLRAMQILRTQCNATFRQISSVTHESYYDVVRMVKGRL